MNSIVEVRTKTGMVIFRMDVYAVFMMYLFRGETVLNVDAIKIFCDGVEQMPPPEIEK